MYNLLTYYVTVNTQISIRACALNVESIVLRNAGKVLCYTERSTSLSNVAAVMLSLIHILIVGQ